MRQGEAVREGGRRNKREKREWLTRGVRFACRGERRDHVTSITGEEVHVTIITGEKNGEGHVTSITGGRRVEGSCDTRHRGRVWRGLCDKHHKGGEWRAPWCLGVLRACCLHIVVVCHAHALVRVAVCGCGSEVTSGCVGTAWGVGLGEYCLCVCVCCVYAREGCCVWDCVENVTRGVGQAPASRRGWEGLSVSALVVDVLI
jgi:hypothetical protein